VERFPEDYFYKCFGPYPFLSVSSWDEAPALIHSLLENPDLLELKRVECREWWLEYKSALKGKVAEMVTDRLLP